ncbi:MAG: hypothetical protein VX777_05785 [Chlamydiota bacterium]|nr:hypothetical protein [Chlamydiota bacterium]
MTDMDPSIKPQASNFERLENSSSISLEKNTLVNTTLPSALEVFKEGDFTESFSGKLSESINPQTTRDLGEELNTARESINETVDSIQADAQRAAEKLNGGEDPSKVFQEIVKKFERQAKPQKTTAEKIEGAEAGVEAVAETSSKVIEYLAFIDELAMQGIPSEVIDLIDVGIFEAKSAVALALNISKVCVMGKEVKALNEKLQNLIEECDSEANPEKKELLENEIALLQDKIEDLTESIKEEAQSLCHSFLDTALDSSKQVLDVTSSFLQSTAHVSSRVLADLAITSSSIGLATGLLGLGVNTYQAVKANKNLHVIQTKIKTLEQEIHEGENPIQNVILSAKTDHLKIVKNEMEINTAKAVVGTVVSGLALTGATKGLLVAAGVSMGTVAAVSLTTAGVAGAVLGGGMTGALAIYGGYKARHDIKYVATTADIPTRLFVNKQQLSREMKMQEAALNQMDESKAIFTQLDAARDVLEKTSKLPGGKESLQKKAMASKQFTDLLSKMDSAVEGLQVGSERLELSRKNIRALEEKISVLNERLSKAKTHKTWKKTEAQFKKFSNIYTLNAVESMVTESLKDPQQQKELTKFLENHDFTSKIPVTFDNVLDFILAV